MKHLNKIFTVTCDDKNMYDECWGETSINLEERETQENAEDFCRGLGWNIEDLDTCPYCHKGLVKEDTEDAEIMTPEGV